MSPDLDQAKPTSPRGQIDLAQLDDKQLSQYRHPAERWSIIAIGIGAAILLSVLWYVHPFGDALAFLPGPLARLIVEWTHPHRVGLVVLLVLLATWVADVIGQSAREWQLVARAVEVTPTTFKDLAPMVDELRERFDLPRTRVYISRETSTGYTVGVRAPYAIVMAANTVAMMTPAEIKFLLGREMGHIKLRHTWAATVLGSANMHLPEPLSYLLKIRKTLFGSYQHAQELSCDRIGVVATRDVRPALSALIKQNLGTVKGSQIDIASLAPQAEALRRGLSGASLRVMQRMSAQPFAVSRLLELIEWAGVPTEQVPTQAAPPPPAAPVANTPAVVVPPAGQDAAAA